MIISGTTAIAKTYVEIITQDAFIQPFYFTESQFLLIFLVFMLGLRIAQNLQIAIYAYLTLSYFLKMKRNYLQRQHRELSAFNYLILAILGLSFMSRLYGYLTIDQINIAKFFTQVCSYPLLYYAFNFGKGVATQMKDIIELILISYLIYHQNKKEKKEKED